MRPEVGKFRYSYENLHGNLELYRAKKIYSLAVSLYGNVLIYD